MPVIIKYVVERDGIEKMTFTSKAEADAYDKLLDTADALYEVLDQSELVGDQVQKEALSMYLAQQKDAVLAILSDKKKTSQSAKKAANKKPLSKLDDNEQVDNKQARAKTAPQKALEDLIIEPDEDALYSEEESNVVFDHDDTIEFVESDAA
ncbi:MAG: YebG family protein [Marinomonas hwangdonensis]|nr:YebG family protein [Marinomonas hwangdonensis]